MSRAVIDTASLCAVAGCQTAATTIVKSASDSNVIENEVTAAARNIWRLDETYLVHVGVYDSRPRTAPIETLAVKTRDLSSGAESYKVTLKVPRQRIHPDRNYVVRAEIRDLIGNPRFITAVPHARSF